MKFLLCILFLTILLFNPRISYTQSKNPTNILIGYGIYEGYNAGFELTLNRGYSSFSSSIGVDHLFSGDSRYLALSAAYNVSILRQRYYWENKYKWKVNFRIVYWNLEDPFYKFNVITFIPSLNRIIYLTKKFGISLDAGPAINQVLHHKRKTFKEVGWPFHVMPNFRALIIF